MTTLFQELKIGTGNNFIRTDINGNLNITTENRCIFNVLPECSEVPTYGDHLVNKTYADGIVIGAPTKLSITDTNINATYYPTFVDSAGPAKILRADISTTPFSFNPSTNILSLNNTTFSSAYIISNGLTISTNTHTVNRRIFQDISASSNNTNISGYYGLTKLSYPSLNPESFGASAVSTWNTRSSATDNSWNSVCWSPQLGIYCAVSSSGIGNRVMTSSDGISWLPQASANDYEWTSICWSPERLLFCAVSSSGSGNRVMTSADGIQWTPQLTPDNLWSSVCWSTEVGLFCSVSIDGSVMTSPDGTNWTSRTAASTNSWTSICWAPELGLFCAVSNTGTDNRVMTSYDGIDWTSRRSAFTNSWKSVSWSSEAGVFCAVSTDGTGNRVMTSSDGFNWTSRTSAADNQWCSICWCPELKLFCATALSGTTNRVMTSPDGIQWTIRTCPNNEWTSVCWSPELGLFCAVSQSGSGNRVMTSALTGRPPTSYNVFHSPFNNIDENGNWTLKAKELRTTDSALLVETTSGNLELKCNSSGPGGNIKLSGGSGLLTTTAGASSGQNLVLTINGTPYKIPLLNVIS